ncbi:MAG: hypothetical protein LBE25_03055 [Arthrobacter sp.]|nr:hypothetical protein [Arthrobacter sp.]
MLSSLLFRAEGFPLDDATFADGGDPVSGFNDSFNRVSDTVDVMFIIIPVAMVLILGFGIFVAVRNYRAAKRQGMDPFAVETELAGRVYNSALLAPADQKAGVPGAGTRGTRTKAERLEEIEGMYRSGTINAEERQRARDAILVED